MTPERWQQIDQLFHATLAREPSQRAGFLANACAGDDTLHSEVASLLSFHDYTDSFIETPAGDVAAELLRSQNSRFEPGQQLENYQIVRPIGSGGMGEVYLAQDLKLGRNIALKILPIEFTTHRERVRRFELEARAASALNHPNIVTIHEIGISDSFRFIATEFVDGQTLRQFMTEFAPELRVNMAKVLDVATQIASALAAAHEAGIVHRDIKPENIMLRRDGFIKILDFGLAKLSLVNGATQPASVTTNPGVVMGTVNYMSPEQARGADVDSRADIWSMGVVLYEFITGRVPFQGETSSHVIVSILEKEPEAPSCYAEIPATLEFIVMKALRKERQDRHQSAADLVIELKNLKQELEAQEHLNRPIQLLPRRDTAASVPPANSRQASAAQTVLLDGPTSTAASPIRIRFNKKAAALVLAVLSLAGGFGFYKLRPNRSSLAPATPFQAIELLRLTNSGRVNDCAISPDGRYVAYIVETGGKQSIWVRHLVNSTNFQIVLPSDSKFYGGTFSRAGEFLYYIEKEQNNSIGQLYRVPTLGGDPVKLITDVDGPITLSPGEKQLAFVRGSSTGERALMLANADGTGERKIASRMGYDAFTFSGPAWSPNGRAIVSGAAYTKDHGRYLTVVEVDVNDGSIKPITSHQWKAIGRISWLQDGKGMVFTATELGAGSTSQLWYMDYKSGSAHRISRDLQDYHGAGLTSDAKTLVTKQTQTLSSLWIAPNDDADRATSILSYKEDTASSHVYYYRTRFSWLPDGRIMYTTIVDGLPNVWVMSVQGTGLKQLAHGTHGTSFPSVTRDSRNILFVSENSGFSNVWRMDIDGSNQKQLTMGQDESWAWSSPDSRWVVYHSGNQGMRTLWRVPIAGGNPEQLTNYPSICPVVSPDGQWISAYYRVETKAPWRLGIIPFKGGEPVKSFEVPQGVLFQSLVRWTPDGTALAYIKSVDGVSNIWSQPLDGGPAKQITNFKSDQIFWFEWSLDGQKLGVSRGAITSDVVMIKR